MENWEIQEIKDSLVLMQHGLEGSREAEMLDKAFDYINELEKRLVEVANSEERARKLLKAKDYTVIKLTKGQLEDAQKCEDSGYNKECYGCRCSGCVAVM